MLHFPKKHILSDIVKKPGLSPGFFLLPWRYYKWRYVFVEKQEKEDMITLHLEKLVSHLESLRIAEYMDLLERPAKLILINLIAGVARGLGIAIGATVIFAVVLNLLHQLILLNIPGIGEFIADIVRIVETKNGKY